MALLNQRERHAYRRALARSVRAVTSGSAWRAREGVLFRQRDGWFVSVTPEVRFERLATIGQVLAKPMASDEIFWKIIGLNALADQPLSFRTAGGIACKAPLFAKTEVEGDPDPDAAARALLALAEAQLDRASAMPTAAFVDFCRAHATAGQSYDTVILPTLVAAGRSDEALAECHAALAAGRRGNFSKNGKSLVEMTIEWIETYRERP